MAAAGISGFLPWHKDQAYACQPVSQAFSKAELISCVTYQATLCQKVSGHIWRCGQLSTHSRPDHTLKDRKSNPSLGKLGTEVAACELPGVKKCPPVFHLSQTYTHTPLWMILVVAFCVHISTFFACVFKCVPCLFWTSRGRICCTCAVF